MAVAEGTGTAGAEAPWPKIRWVIFSILFLLAFFAYVQRTSISVVADAMMPDLGFTQDQVGWIMDAFLISYTIFQFPTGVLGERFGARVTLTVAGLVAVAAALATPILPMVFGGAALFMALLATRFVLGVSNAPIFPVSSGVFERWFPAGQWGCPQGLQACGMGLGAAATTAVVAALTDAVGWKMALIVTSLPALAIVVIWAWYGRNTPAEHRSVGAAELAELGAAAMHAPPSRVTPSRVLRLLANREVLLLSISYMLMNYLFYILFNWCFLYLMQERHFSNLEGGLLGSLPPIAAALGSGVGGRICDALCQRFGILWGYRLVPLLALPGAGVAMIVAVYAASPYLAVLWLSVGFALTESTEGAFWATTMQVAKTDTTVAASVLNTGGNIGGVIATPLIAALSGRGHWTAAFVTGAVLAFISAALWLWVDARREIPDPVPGEA
jgi:ACS family glucarate transporter-like MFS transporter